MKGGVYTHHRQMAPKKKVYATYTKKKISVEKKTRLTPKKKLRDLHQKKIKRQLTLISTIELRFPSPHLLHHASCSLHIVFCYGLKKG